MSSIWREGCAIVLLMTASASGAPSEGLLPISLDGLCVTKGTIIRQGGKLHTESPTLRAVVRAKTREVADIRFTYLGPTIDTAQLGSGATRRQVGLKLRAENGCNLVYAMWRVEPESKLVVSLKRNPGQSTHAECENRGYQNIKPRAQSAVPKLVPGSHHDLRAVLSGRALLVFADGARVWEGELPEESSTLSGPVGFRSDNVRVDFEFLAEVEAAGANPLPGNGKCGELDAD